MALTIKQLNSDTSFLLSLEPISDHPDAPAGRPFTILLDPWITTPTAAARTSLAKRRTACIESLSDLASPPDLVVISSHQPNHCNEATLRQLPASGSKTLILATQKAARTVRGWRYFDKEKVRALHPWQDPRTARKKERVVRVAVPPAVAGGGAGEVTVAFIPQRKNKKHGAVGITYRPPSAGRIRPQRRGEHVSTSSDTLQPYSPDSLYPYSPTSPHAPSLRSVRSTASLARHLRDRCISILYSPHGIEYSSVEAYATSHLVAEAALPLTALVHCFDSVVSPWWLGGKSISAGLPAGRTVASRLGARAWISAHDGANAEGIMARWASTRVYSRGEVVEALAREEHVGKRSLESEDKKVVVGIGATEVLELGIGGEVVMTNQGVWKPVA